MIDKEQLIADIKESREDWKWIEKLEKKFDLSPHYNWIASNLRQSIVEKELEGKDFSKLKDQLDKFNYIIERTNELTKKYDCGLGGRLCTMGMEEKLGRMLVNE